MPLGRATVVLLNKKLIHITAETGRESPQQSVATISLIQCVAVNATRFSCFSLNIGLYWLTSDCVLVTVCSFIKELWIYVEEFLIQINEVLAGL